MLLQCLGAGVGDAMTVLFDRYYRLVLTIAYRILRDRAEAEDLMQEVFLEIFRDADKYDSSRGSVKTWLLQYVYHRSLNRKQYLSLRGFYNVFRREPNQEIGVRAGRRATTPKNHGRSATPRATHHPAGKERGG